MYECSQRCVPSSNVLTSPWKRLVLRAHLCCCVSIHPAQLCKKGSNLKLVIKLAEHSGTGLVVVEGGTEKDANTIKQMIDTIQV